MAMTTARMVARMPEGAAARAAAGTASGAPMSGMRRSRRTATVPSAQSSHWASQKPTESGTAAAMLRPTSRRSTAPTARRVANQTVRAVRRRSTGKNDSQRRSNASRPPVQ